NLVTGAETYFDNDRHIIGIDHVLASTALPGLPPVAIERQPYAGPAASVAALEEPRPADTRCFVVAGYDPVPGPPGGARPPARAAAAPSRRGRSRAARRGRGPTALSRKAGSIRPFSPASSAPKKQGSRPAAPGRRVGHAFLCC